MELLTEDATLVCNHELGIVNLKTSQNLVTIDGRIILVDNNPENCGIVGCPNLGINIVPCNMTLKVKRGYSNLVTIEQKRVCLDPVEGLTNGTPPGMVSYKVRFSGQPWVVEKP
jgi:hypothetical protein